MRHVCTTHLTQYTGIYKIYGTLKVTYIYHIINLYCNMNIFFFFCIFWTYVYYAGIEQLIKFQTF